MLPKLPSKGMMPTTIGNQMLPGKPGGPKHRPESVGNQMASGMPKKGMKGCKPMKSRM